MVLPAGLPREEQQTDGVQHFLRQFDAFRCSLDDDAPRDTSVGIHAICFDGHRCCAEGRVQLGAFSCSENQGSVIHLEVDGENVGMIDCPYCQAPN